MSAHRTTAQRKWPTLAAACLLLSIAACGSTDDAAQRASDSDAPGSGSGLTADTVGDVTVHSYLGASLSNGTYVIESASSLVVVDTQYQDGDPEAFRAAVDSLDKPIATVLITHDHPDHVGGLNTAFADESVATTATVAGLIDAGDREVDVLDGSFTIDGVDYLAEEFLDAEASAQMVLTLPDHDAIFTGDLVFNETHLFLTPTSTTGSPSSTASSSTRPPTCTPVTAFRPIPPSTPRTSTTSAPPGPTSPLRPAASSTRLR